MRFRLGVCVIAAAAFASPAHARLPVPRHQNPIGAENVQPGTRSWLAADNPAPAVEAYAGSVSALPGEAIQFHVASRAPLSYRITILRLGWYGGDGARVMTCLPSCIGWNTAVPRPRPVPDPVTGEVAAMWPATDELEVPSDWTSGVYEARVSPVDEGVGPPSLVLFVVREPSAARSTALVDIPVNTWQAYNSWGGKSLYNFNSDGQIPANHVSFARPYEPGGQDQFFRWSIQLVRFLERGHYDVSYTTDVDIDADPAELLRHRLVIVAGHGEYWTSRMRDAFDAARDAGTNLAFVGANIGYWQVRYADGRRTIVSYKLAPDPFPDRSQQTTLFRALAPPRYECALEGVQHEGAFLRRGEPTLDYTVNGAALSDPWFDGTGFAAGDVVRGVVGPEWDRVVSPKDAWTCAFPNLEVLFHYEGAPGNADAVRYTAASGARVFSAGSLGFVWALDQTDPHDPPADQRVQRFMGNALDDLFRPQTPELFVTRSVYGDAAVIHVSEPDDSRLRGIIVVRHRGSRRFSPERESVAIVCRGQRSLCIDEHVPPDSTVRYAAVTFDDWGASLPAFSAPVRRGRRP